MFPEMAELNPTRLQNDTSWQPHTESGGICLQTAIHLSIAHPVLPVPIRQMVWE